MKSRAAVLWGVGKDWSIEEIEVGDPRPGEVLVRWLAAGLCHSDEHFVTGDVVLPDALAALMGMENLFPLVGGHEGCGEVVATGPGVTSFAVGDRVAASFVPSCGRCRYCATGRTNLCDLGSETMRQGQIGDGEVQHFVDGRPLTLFAKCGTFSEHTLMSELSLVKVASWYRPEVVALVSCGVATGWGSAVHRAGTLPGDVVVVVGCGGVGMNAVQGAAMAGARAVVAVDPVELKRDVALTLGATHACDSMGEAHALVNELSWGQMADRVILVPGSVDGSMLATAMALTGKGGTCVVTASSPVLQTEVTLSLIDLAMMNKEIKGTIFGSGNPRFDIPNLLRLYDVGQLKLDELVTRTYALDEINQGYQDMRDGKNIRGVIAFD
jgi:S-(hydroxymethyl)glutathione dehydrogenase/alcohol dehydrogenase